MVAKAAVPFPIGFEGKVRPTAVYLPPVASVCKAVAAIKSKLPKCGTRARGSGNSMIIFKK
jgi:hypothetical protein